jgi:UDP-N-acetylglucosamine transferase subunit ALG13
MIVWCSISAHGFGHAAQLMPILNELGTVIDDLRVILRTQVPADFFQRHLNVKWELQVAQQDVGCIQRGPLDLDVAATWDAYTQFHTNWEQKVAEEAQAIRSAKANLVISNISHLAIAGASQAHCPVVGIASLSWDRVLEPYMHDHSPSHRSILETIRSGYALADHLIRLYPGIEMPAFPSTVDVGPSVPLMMPNSHDLRTLLGVAENEKIVLIAFGGIPLNRLPLKQMESLDGFQLLVGDLPSSPSYARVHRLEDLAMPFSEIIKQVDIIMSKPGYGTIMAAVHYGKALVYVRRGNFVDEQGLVDYAHRYGQGMELSRHDFESGDWEATLRAVLTVPAPSEPPPLPGNSAVVRFLRTYLQPCREGNRDSF